ncbi:MAG: NAD(P)/FAD-dependent oxidoreductase [Cyanobium sp.]
MTADRTGRDPAAPDRRPAAAAATASGDQADGAGSEAIVIVGGGFGGLYTALALSERPDHPPILLIEPQEQFLFLPLLYELLSGELRRWEIAPRYDKLLAGRGIAWLQDRVERIEPERRRLHTRCGRQLAYRQLVLACGGCGATYGVPGADQHTLAFRSLADVDRLQALVARLARRSRPLQRLAVVGAGPSGVELACKLADLCAGSAVIDLIEQGPQLLPQARAFNREQAELALRRRDVRVRTHTAVAAVDADRLRLRHRAAAPGDTPLTLSEELLPVDGVIWTAGLVFRPPAIVPSAPQDGSGRLLCEPSLRLQGYPDLFVIGDLARPEPSDSPLPSTAQVAFQQASLLADNLLRARIGEPLQPFQWTDLGEMLSLGRQEATLCAGGLTLAGRLAFQIRRLAYLSRMPGLPHTLRVAAGWLAEQR